MATLIELEAAERVFKLDPVLAPQAQEFRMIYVLPELKTWFENELPRLGSTRNLELHPIEQLDALIETFCAGDVLAFGWMFKPLTHIRDGIWELKTADVRLFGWFHAKDCFVGSAANLADTVKRLHMYQAYREEAVRRRNALDLDEPKFIPGDDPNAVVSNFDYP